MKKLLFIILLIINSIFALAVSGKVVKVSDGDTFYLKTDGKTYKIRMYGIDAPELHQQYGEESKKYLENLILDKNVDVNVKSQDRYGRKVGKVIYKNKDINLEMIKSGNAWYYEYYARNERDYRKAFEYAQENKLGLWQGKNIENPREYRLKHKRED